MDIGPARQCGAAGFRRVPVRTAHPGNNAPQLAKGLGPGLGQLRQHVLMGQFGAEHQLVQGGAFAGKTEIDQAGAAQLLQRAGLGVWLPQRGGQFAEALGGQMPEQFTAVGEVVVGGRCTHPHTFGYRPQGQPGWPRIFQQLPGSGEQLWCEVAYMVGIP